MDFFHSGYLRGYMLSGHFFKVRSGLVMSHAMLLRSDAIDTSTHSRRITAMFEAFLHDRRGLHVLAAEQALSTEFELVTQMLAFLLQ